MFNIKYNAENGGLESLVIKGDKYGMNWVESQTATFGIPYINLQIAFNRFMGFEVESIDINGDSCKAVYSNPFVKVEVKRENNGKYREEYIITNTSVNELFFPMGEIGVDIPFNDNYEDAETCLTGRCNTHIWCGEESSYVMALRMGASKLNCGLVVTKGNIGGYTQTTPPYAKNDRGDFRFDFSPFSLLPGESYTFSHEMFVFEDKSDFYNKAYEYDNFVHIRLNNYTLFKGERLIVDCYTKNEAKSFSIKVNGKEIPAMRTEYGVWGECKCNELGELRVDLCINGIMTHALAYVSPPLDELIEKRIDFIVEKQQYHKKGSALDGAYLLYDNETDSIYFNNMVSDHNASRERLGMGIVIAKYLQSFPNQKFYDSLMEYKDFVFREFCDKETGEVFDTIGKDATQVRLYNAPWVCVFCCELYTLTEDKEYLEIMFRVMKHYYENGGDKFYPNGITIYEPIELLNMAEMYEEADALLKYAIKHCENMMEYGVSYPKHEVDYEQTIVTPAVTFMLSLYRLTDDERYLENAMLHMENLERFDSMAPDYHLFATPIRHWDDYWFGKEQTFCDTFPHYWSVLSGWAYDRMARADYSYKYDDMAEQNIRNCLCLFTPEGRSYCAYLYPFRIGKKKGKLFDAYANDQDFALYFAMKRLGFDD